MQAHVEPWLLCNQFIITYWVVSAELIKSIAKSAHNIDVISANSNNNNNPFGKKDTLVPLL